MNRKLEVVFVGARHPHIFPRLSLCLQTEDVSVRGIYDSDPALSRRIAEEYKIPWAESIESLFQHGQADLVIIEGHDPENPDYVQQILGRTRVLLIEKPGAPTLEKMERMVKSIEQSGIHAQLGYMYNYSSVIKKSSEILQSGALGPITLARFHAGAPVGGAAEIWQSLPEDMGGVLFTDGCHMLALLVRILGIPSAVVGRIFKIEHGPDVFSDIYKKDTLAGLGESTRHQLGAQLFEDAGAAILQYSDKLATFDVTGWEAHNWVEAWSIEIFGTDGTLKISLVPAAYQLWIRRAHAQFDPGWHTWEGAGSASGPGASLVVDENYANEMADLFNRLRLDLPPDLTALREGLEVVRIADAIYREAGAF